MNIWLDTTNAKIIQTAVRFGVLTGVTTNPTLIAQTKRKEQHVLKDLLHYQEGPVTAQVTSLDVAEMVQQGQSLYSFSKRIIVKVPVTQAGLEAIHLLSRQGIPTMATVVFDVQQALMAALAGAAHVAIYITRIEKAGKNPWDILASILKIFQNYKLKTKILGASISSVEQVLKCAEMGINAVTIKEEVFGKLIADSPLTQESVKQFLEYATQSQTLDAMK